MSKKKKITIVGAAIVVIAAIVVALLYFFGVFGGKEYNYDLSKYVKVGKYKDLKYDKISVSVSDADVKKEIQARCEKKQSTKQVKSGTVEDGDTINIAFDGKIDGKSFDGGSSESTDITIGKTSMIDGFTDGLIGKKVGDTVTLNLKFPKDYSQNEKVAGKDVTFKVTINSKSVTTIPDYNLDFVKKYSDYDTLADYEASIKKELEKKAKEDAEYDVKNNLWTEIVSNSKVIKYPDKELEKEKKTTTQKYKDMADNYSVSWDEFRKSQLGYSTDEAFDKAIEKYAKQVVFQKMVMYYIADKEGIEVSNTEYKDYLKKLLKDAGFTEKTFKENYKQSIEDYGEAQDLKSGLILDKVMDKIMEYSKAK